MSTTTDPHAGDTIFPSGNHRIRAEPETKRLAISGGELFAAREEADEVYSEGITGADRLTIAELNIVIPDTAAGGVERVFGNAERTRELIVDNR